MKLSISKTQYSEDKHEIRTRTKGLCTCETKGGLEGGGERGGVEDSENISHPKVRKNMLNKFYIMHRFETGLIISGKKKPNQIKSPPPPKKSQLVRPIVKLRNN